MSYYYLFLTIWMFVTCILYIETFNKDVVDVLNIFSMQLEEMYWADNLASQMQLCCHEQRCLENCPSKQWVALMHKVPTTLSHRHCSATTAIAKSVTTADVAQHHFYFKLVMMKPKNQTHQLPHYNPLKTSFIYLLRNLVRETKSNLRCLFKTITSE